MYVNMTSVKQRFYYYIIEYGSRQLLASGISGFTNNVSEKTVKVIRQEKLNRIIIDHLNINAIRNKSDLLAN